MMNVESGVSPLVLPTSKRTSAGRWFLFGAEASFAITGVAKVWSFFASTKTLSVADPITGLSFGHLMLAVGVLELFTASICVFSKSQPLKLGLIAWLATGFVVYRFGLWWMGWKKPCSCLGNLTDALHISPQAADTAMKIILAYLLIGSYASLFWLWRQKRQAVSALAPTGPSAPSPAP